MLARGHYDLALYKLAIRNVANYSPPVVELEPGEMPEWEIAAAARGDRRRRRAPQRRRRRARRPRVSGAGAEGGQRPRFATSRDATPTSSLAALSADGRGPERILDLMLRTGPYGDGFGADPTGCRSTVLEANPHGVDLGPLQPRLPEVLRTPTRQDRARARADRRRRRRRLRAVARPRRANGELVLVGRRDLRSNNSWMHNLDILVKGKERCTLHVHPDDAARLGLVDGAGGPGAVAGRARSRSRSR